MIYLDRFMRNARRRKDPEAALKVVKRCERQFHGELEDAIGRVFEDGTPRVITLAGPSCSGKTTTATKLTERIDATGKNAVMLSLDDFFLVTPQAERNDVDSEAPDYDSVKAMDLDYLGEFIEGLLNGKTVRVPVYSFTETKRTGYTELKPESSDIYVFEGIQAVYPEITSMLGDHKSIFICPDTSVSYKGKVLKDDELRLMRRIVRDYKFRDATVEFTLHLWKKVRENEIKSIFPYSGSSDVYIDSFLEYEPFVISQFVMELLKTVPENSAYRAEADELASRVGVYDLTFFNATHIPENSVFREFIGEEGLER